MFCNNCGANIPDNAEFCPECGNKIKQQKAVDVVPAGPAPGKQVPVRGVQQGYENYAEAEPKKKGKFPKVLIPVAAVVVVVIVVVALFATGTISLSGGASKLAAVRVSVDNNVLYNTKGEINKEFQEDGIIDEWQNSVDGSMLVFAATVDDERGLYYTGTELEPVQISDDVRAFILSFSGDRIFYAEGDSYYDADLYVYDLKKKEANKISNGVYSGSIVVSPDGKSVAFIKDYESDFDNELYFSSNGKDPEKVAMDGCIPVVVGNGGKILFYVNVSNDNRLYYYNGKDETRLATDVYMGITTNRTGNELIYKKGGKSYYFTTKMDEPVKLCSDTLYSVLGVQSMYHAQDIENVDSFRGAVMSADEGTYWINKKGTDVVRICGDTSYVRMAGDGKSLIYTKHGRLYSVPKIGDKMDEKEVYEDEEILMTIASRDLSNIWFITEEDRLYYCNKNGKTERISNDVQADTGVIAWNEATGQVYFIEDGSLYSAGKNESSKKLVMDDVNVCYAMNGGISFYTKDEEGYICFDGEPVLTYE